MTEEKWTRLYANLMGRIHKALIALAATVIISIVVGGAMMIAAGAVLLTPWTAVGNYLNSLLPTDPETWRWLGVVLLLWVILQELKAIRKLLSYEPGE
jgi:hypothetical protein